MGSWNIWRGPASCGAQAVYAAESPLPLRVRRYGPHVGRPARRGTGDYPANEGIGPAQANGRSADRHTRACGGTHANQLAFTICDVTLVDKTPAGACE